MEKTFDEMERKIEELERKYQKLKNDQDRKIREIKRSVKDIFEKYTIRTERLLQKGIKESLKKNCNDHIKWFCINGCFNEKKYFTLNQVDKINMCPNIT